MNAYEAYLESKILTADPLELVRVLYRGAIESVEGARSALHAGDIPQRTQNINRALMILTELTSSLQHEDVSTIARSLSELYDYMQRKLLEAQFQQSDPPLAEVSTLLKTLLEGWDAWRQEPALPQAFESEPGEQYAQLSCSY
ncbi:MAG: flagellar export chaperone FliS [Bryobacteraceae bacterium]